ncbi:MAG: hypothetical protein CMM46_03820 [Rhodospirillaceae bacterium]|nr:hypothetical protein [Rhodospirillaceae bacterium]|tara:strand:- start:904 stop:1557 length:654 start_codon:yes stop_codon:yes gene_type:complete
MCVTKIRTERLIDLDQRGAPQQKRAREAFERILAATTDLIDEIGIDRITTINVAERAGVNVSSLYRYFPNKYALVQYLARRLGERQNVAVNAYLETVNPERPWQEVLDGIVDAMVDVSCKERGAVPLQRALLAVPELREEYRRSAEDVGTNLEKFLQRWGVDLPRDRINLIIMSMGECSAAMLDLAVSKGASYNRDVVRELKRVFRGYLETYLHTDN